MAMKPFSRLGLLRLLAASAFLSQLTIGLAQAQTNTKPYEPVVAQQGKDVIWVPTPNDLVVKMLETAKVNSNDLVYDLGAGDGKIPIQAARQFGARAVGIEYNPEMAALARRNAQQAGVGDKVTIITGDIFKEDFSNATVVTLYLLTSLNIRLKPTILDMKPGTRVVSNSFMMGSWEPDEIVSPEGGGRGYFWVVPAKIQGDWSVNDLPGLSTALLSINQKFQKIEGTLTFSDNRSQKVQGRLNGSQLSFTYRDAHDKPQTFVGQVSNSKLNGSIKDQPAAVITATKLR
ncbi:class I SAM-dependent methyltransferase [Zwartia sp.]|uniref:class I SAM-dependent methyltransferase n=1 Tax=Zwartia sp. TaxID=2978004 RepID=UPI0027292F8C|nr:class I SAM-dependent methyltransferase [Zwartia sp.]MDO9025940.1 class I SAM-dependent methyltransferase [Zwartia sp.]